MLRDPLVPGSADVSPETAATKTSGSLGEAVAKASTGAEASGGAGGNGEQSTQVKEAIKVRGALGFGICGGGGGTVSKCAL